MVNRLLLFCGALCALFPRFAGAQTARVQFIDNSPTRTIDIYANDSLVFRGLSYRNSSPFLTLPIEGNDRIRVSASGVSGPTTAFTVFPAKWDSGKTYIAVVGSATDGTLGFNLATTNQGRRFSASDKNVDLIFFNGASDGPTLAVTNSKSGITEKVAPGQFGAYQSVLAAGVFTETIASADAPTPPLAAYDGDLSFWKGNTAVIFTSGSLSGQGTPFEPWVALSNGGGFPLKAKPVTDSTARVQFIQNVATSPAAGWDVYVNGKLAAKDLTYLSATPYLPVPNGGVTHIGVAPSGSKSVADTTSDFAYTFVSGKRYVALADGLGAGFKWSVFDGARTQALNPSLLDIAFANGSTDIAQIDAASLDGRPLASGLAAGSFSDYTTFSYGTNYIALKAGGKNDALGLFALSAGFSFIGKSGVIIATGAANGTPGFGALLVLSDGRALRMFQKQLAQLQLINDAPTKTVDVYLNDGLLYKNLAFRSATPYLTIPAGATFNLGFAPSGSASVRDTFMNYRTTIGAGKRYLGVTAGVVGSPYTPFNLALTDMGKEVSNSPDQVDVAFFQGSSDAPAFNLSAGPTAKATNLSYKSFSAYGSIAATPFTLTLSPVANAASVFQYKGDISYWKGKTAVIFLSGYIGGGVADFEPWVALSNGGAFPLTIVPQGAGGAGRDAGGETLALYPNPATSALQLDYTAERTGDVTLDVFNAAGQSVLNQKYAAQTGAQHWSIDVSAWTNGVYILRMGTEQGVTARKILVSKR